MNSARGRLAATGVTAVIAAAVAVVPFTSGAALTADSGEADGADTPVTLPDGELVDGDVEATVERTISEASKTVEQTVGSAPEPVGSSTSTSTSTSTTTTTVPPAPDEEEGTAEVEDRPKPTASRGAADTGAKEARPAPRGRVDTVLHRLRALDPEPVAALDDAPVGFPRIDFVDIPLGPRSTADIVQLVGTDPEMLAAVLAPFPVAGAASYSNDWGVPRHGPGALLRTHQGTDIFASRGTPVVASGDGVVSRLTTTALLGGISLRLTLPGGTFMYYAHLEDFAPGIREGARVSKGDVLGYVGTSGNAEGTPPHLHFQIHPGGGEPVPPLPYLDRWLQEARQRAEGFVGAPGSEVAAGGGFVPGFEPYSGPFFPAAPASSEGSPSGNVGPAVVVALVVAGGLATRRRLSRRPAPTPVATARAWWETTPGAVFPRSVDEPGRRPGLSLPWKHRGRREG